MKEMSSSNTSQQLVINIIYTKREFPEFITETSNSCNYICDETPLTKNPYNNIRSP